jgi:hypothetical protein
MNLPEVTRHLTVTGAQKIVFSGKNDGPADLSGASEPDETQSSRSPSPHSTARACVAGGVVARHEGPLAEQVQGDE